MRTSAVREDVCHSVWGIRPRSSIAWMSGFTARWWPGKYLVAGFPEVAQVRAIRNSLRLLALCVIAWSSSLSEADPMPNALDGVYLMPGVEFSVAVDNKGCWPNLLLLPSGEILATFYNHPSHGFGCGDIELWVSADGAQTWQFRSKVSDHGENPKHCRMNHAFGLTAAGEIVALVSGWSEGRRKPILPLQVCISSDGGRSWKRHLLTTNSVPFGKIVLNPDGRLTCVMRSAGEDACFHTSSDNGQNWTPTSTVLRDSTYETALLRCRNGKWLAAGRTNKGGINLFSSTDEGRTWTAPRAAPLPGYPADLLELADGRVLLVAGRRDSLRGITGCLSNDQGETWSPYWMFISVRWAGDHGYPSSVQLPDGLIVTAYYWGGRAAEGKYGGRTDLPDSRGLPWHPRYHMGVMRWRPGELPLPK